MVPHIDDYRKIKGHIDKDDLTFCYNIREGKYHLLWPLLIINKTEQYLLMTINECSKIFKEQFNAFEYFNYYVSFNTLEDLNNAVLWLEDLILVNKLI